MKNLFLGLAALCLTFACASEERASFEEGMSANPKATECCKEGSECSAEKAAECSSKQASECKGEQKVCPVTGQIE